MPLPKKGWQESPTFSHGFRPLPFTSGSSAVPTLLAGKIIFIISHWSFRPFVSFLDQLGWITTRHSGRMLQPYLSLAEHPTQAFPRPDSVLSILEWWCLSLVSGSMSVSSCLRTMQWSTPPYQLPRSSLQGVSALPVPHFIRGKTPSALTTRLPCRWLESILEVSGRLLSNRYLIKGGSIRIRLRVWTLGARASPSHDSSLRALEPWLGGPFGLVWGLMAGLRCCASHGCIISI